MAVSDYIRLNSCGRRRLACELSGCAGVLACYYYEHWRLACDIKQYQVYKPGSVPFQVFIINLEVNIAAAFSRFLPSDLREQRSNIGLHGIAAHSMLVSHHSSL